MSEAFGNYLREGPFGEKDELVARGERAGLIRCWTIRIRTFSPRKYTIEEYECYDVNSLGDLKRGWQDDPDLDTLKDINWLVVQVRRPNSMRPETIIDVREAK